VSGIQFMNMLCSLFIVMITFSPCLKIKFIVEQAFDCSEIQSLLLFEHVSFFVFRLHHCFYQLNPNHCHFQVHLVVFASKERLIEKYCQLLLFFFICHIGCFWHGFTFDSGICRGARRHLSLYHKKYSFVVALEILDDLLPVQVL